MSHGAETFFSELKRYVRFGEADAAALLRFHPLAEPHFERIALTFYERIREHEDAHNVFTSEAQIERLQRTLVRWLGRLMTGPHDEAYFEERAKIGQMHVRVGLPQRYTYSAMAVIRGGLYAIADTLPRDEALPIREALGRILDLELAIMNETFREDFVARLQRIERLERQELERALARTERRYATAIQCAHVLVVGLDRASRILLFNQEAEAVTGYARDEVLGRDFVTLFLPEGVRETEGESLRRAARGERDPMEGAELPLCTRAGKTRHIAWQLGSLPATIDEEMVLFAIGSDVTEARALAERTRQSERLAAVGTLAAGLAHEIRNPLNGALLHVTYLERALKRSRGNDDGDALEAAHVIAAEIQRLSALVRDFLVFARPAPPVFNTTSLRAVVERTLAMVAPDAGRAQAAVSLDAPEGDPFTLHCDGAKVEQFVMNLVRNAIDAVAMVGGGKVVVRLRHRPREVLVEVEDAGPGMPNPDAPIFDAFYSTKANGTGLGLAIVHRLVSDHGGQIQFDSAPGKTVFRVTLPKER
ncbi:MAG: PAS domain S-box protein [Myxococcales bacterium]|nr:PAS domain S-box protein [Myxococcales bacterium]